MGYIVVVGELVIALEVVLVGAENSREDLQEFGVLDGNIKVFLNQKDGVLQESIRKLQHNIAPGITSKILEVSRADEFLAAGREHAHEKILNAGVIDGFRERHC